MPRACPTLAVAVACAAVAVLHGLGAPPPPPLSSLRAGAARIDITPDQPLGLEGYENPENRISIGVHDRLYARALAIGSGTRRLVFVSCDLGTFLFAEYYRRQIIDRFDLRPDELFLCATHTHSGPQLSLSPDFPHPNNRDYTRVLERRLLDVVGSAVGSMAAARVSLGRGRSDVGISRRSPRGGGRTDMAPNPDGAADHELLVLQLARPGAGPFAVLFDYACHSRSLRSGNRLVSGDVFGLAEQFVERRRADAPLVAAAFAGASGDVDPASVVDGFDAVPGEVPVTERLAALLGGEVVRAMATAGRADVGAGVRTTAVRLQLPPKVAGQVKWLNVIAAAVGDVAFVGLDCEASVEIGLAIKAASPFRATFVMTHCNGWVGYLPVAHQYPEGGYEVGRSGFGQEAAAVLVGEVSTLLSRLHQAR
jgi:hypothetical protein